MGKKVYYEYDGFTGTIDQWAKRLRVRPRTLRKRIYTQVKGQEDWSKVFHAGNLREFCGPCTVARCKRKERVVGGNLCRQHEYRLNKYGSVDGEYKAATADPEYIVWQNMLASDIEVEWENYWDFKRDMGDKKGRILCRKRWDRGFSSKNCFWGTRAQSRHGAMLKYDGRKMSIQAWSVVTGISASTIAYRLKAGWPVERILTKGAIAVDVDENIH